MVEKQKFINLFCDCGWEKHTERERQPEREGERGVTTLAIGNVISSFFLNRFGSEPKFKQSQGIGLERRESISLSITWYDNYGMNSFQSKNKHKSKG